MSRLVAILGGKSTKTFSIVMAAALLIVAARIAGPFEIGKDQSSQLEAAQRLADGLGLTTTNDVPPASYDIVIAPQPKYLTWWPPGFSVVMAGLLLVGLPLVAALKILYSFVTIVGWCAWAILVSRFVSQGIKIGHRVYPAHVLIFCLPIFFTPKWSGTDLFLWAGVPTLILLLFNSRRVNSSRASLSLIAIAGLLFGFLCSIRYATLCLSVPICLILLQFSLPGIMTVIKKGLVFATSATCTMLPVFLYSKIYSLHNSAVPSYVAKEFTGGMVNDSLLVLLRRLPSITNIIFGIPLLDQGLTKLGMRWLNTLVGIICFVVIALLPILIWKHGARVGRRLTDNLALSLSILPITLVTSIILTNVYFLGVRRYYEPIALCCVLLAYEIASSRIAHRWLLAASYVVLATFGLYTFVYMPALIFSPTRRDYVTQSILGFMPPKSPRYRSTSKEVGYVDPDEMFSQKESSREKIAQLFQQNRDALFFVEEYGFFNYDRFDGGGPELGKHVRVYPRPRFWEQAYTSKSVQVFWVINEGTDLNFVPPDQLKLIYTDAYEKTKILESRFPESYKFDGGKPGPAGTELLQPPSE